MTCRRCKDTGEVVFTDLDSGEQVLWPCPDCNGPKEKEYEEVLGDSNNR